MLRWVLFDNHKLSSGRGDAPLMNFLPEEKRPQQVIDFMQGRLRAAYVVLDAHLMGAIGSWATPSPMQIFLAAATSTTQSPSI